MAKKPSPKGTSRSTIWTEEEIKLLKEYRPAHTLTQTHAEFKRRGFNRSKKAIERKCAGLGIFYVEPKVEQKEREEALRSTWNGIRVIKEKYKDQGITTRGRGIVKSGEKLRKILCISDLHIPFERDDLVEEAIKEHKDADILVVNGDLMDLHAVSTWPKDKNVALHEEYKIAMEYMRMFSKTFPQVIVTRGNHEFRLNRYFHQNVSSAISFLVNKEILGHLCNGLVYDSEGNIIEKHDFSNVSYIPGQEAWFFKIGKTMFLHPQSFSKVDGKTGVLAWEYFMDREDIDSVVTGHTHHQALIFKKGRMIIEQGCLCVPLDYAKQGKLNYGPQCLGYAVLYQDQDGNTDFNMSNITFKGIQYPTKKSFEELDLDLHNIGEEDE